MHQHGAETAAPVIGMDIDLFEMRRGWLEDLDVRESDGSLVIERDPELAKSLNAAQHFLTGRLGEH
jgi:hypothetical protein